MATTHSPVSAPIRRWLERRFAIANIAAQLHIQHAAEGRLLDGWVALLWATKAYDERADSRHT